MLTGGNLSGHNRAGYHEVKKTLISMGLGIHFLTSCFKDVCLSLDLQRHPKLLEKT